MDGLAQWQEQDDDELLYYPDQWQALAAVLTVAEREEWRRQGKLPEDIAAWAVQFSVPPGDEPDVGS